MVLGVVLFEQIWSFEPYYMGQLLQSKFFFTYDGFHWIKPLPELESLFLFRLLYLAAILFALGIFYRLSAVLLFLGWTYLFLICKGHYNNHYYLYCLLPLIYCLIDGWKWGSVPLLFKKTAIQYIPRWHLSILQFQLAIVYIFGGIAKLHADWLQGFPMRFWLYDKSQLFTGWFQLFLQTELASLFYAYGGILFDLTIVFFLLNRRTRNLALIPLAFFHISNHFFWQIGSFPFTMLFATILFFEPDTGQRLYELLRHPVQHLKRFMLNQPVRTTLFFFSPFHGNTPHPKPQQTVSKSASSVAPVKWKQIAVRSFLVVYVLFQVLFPFRHFLYIGHPSWTGEGHLFAWRMMLVDTVEAFRMELVLPGNKESYPVAIEEYIGFTQFSRAQRTPTAMLRFAHFIRDEVKQKGGIPNPGIKIVMFKSVNERTPKVLNDTTLNYAMVPYNPFTHASWLTDWQEREEPPSFSLDKYEHWKAAAVAKNK